MTNVPVDNAQVRCAFCRGWGKDPFEVMSELSVCCVCLGKGMVTVQTPYDRCAHCGGTGAIKTFTCTVCHGRGVLPAIKGLAKTCPTCCGTGDDSSASAMCCLECRGRGKIPLGEGMRD